MVLRGEPDMGKTTLLDHAEGSATEFRLRRVSGIG
jgi:hypothetical protein